MSVQLRLATPFPHTSMPPMTFSTVRAAARTATFLLPWAIVGCSMSDAEERSHAGETQVAEGEIGAWSPSSLSEVKGIPIATLRTAVQQRLGGKQPGTVGDEAR